MNKETQKPIKEGFPQIGSSLMHKKTLVAVDRVITRRKRRKLEKTQVKIRHNNQNPEAELKRINEKKRF